MGGPNLITWALKSRALPLARGIRDAAVRGGGCWVVLAAQGEHLGGSKFKKREALTTGSGAPMVEQITENV